MNKHRSALKSRNVYVSGRRTTIKLEPQYWQALQDITARLAVPLRDLLPVIQASYPDHTLTGAVRVWALTYFQELAKRQATEQENASC